MTPKDIFATFWRALTSGAARVVVVCLRGGAAAIFSSRATTREKSATIREAPRLSSISSFMVIRHREENHRIDGKARYQLV